MANLPLNVLVAHSRYQPLAVLGYGASGFVLSATDTLTDRTVAIKFVDRKALLGKHLQREILHHRECVHPHVVRFLEVFVAANHVAIVMEYASGGTLRKYVTERGCLAEEAARWFFQQLILAVDYCHRRGVMNRDLKLDNTLLHWQEGLPREKDGIPTALLKICDFGYAKAEHESAPRSRVGTIYCMAPEVILNSNAATYDGKLADVWSCGVILYEMLFGDCPFHDPTQHVDSSPVAQLRALLDRITSINWQIPEGRHMSEACMDVLRCMLTAVEQRATIQQIQQLPWFLTDLAPGASSMNDFLMSVELPASPQSVQDINTLLADAQQALQMDLAKGVVVGV